MTDVSRDQQLLEEFKAGLDKDGPVVLAQRIAALEAELAAANELLGEDDAHAAQIEALTAERDAAIARAEKAEGGERRAKASLTKATMPAKPRKLGATTGDRPTNEEFLQEIADADEVQIAFSDGTREVPGLSPVNVAGEAWKPHQFGLLLKETVEISGPDEGTSVTIDGYALVLDGKQVAYCRRSTPLQVAPGQRVNITDDIIF